MSVLESSLSKLSRYDEGSLIGSILSFTVSPTICKQFDYIKKFVVNYNVLINLKQNVSGSGKELGQAYVNFTRNCMDQIRSKVTDDLWIINFFEVYKKINPKFSCNYIGQNNLLYFHLDVVYYANANIM